MKTSQVRTENNWNLCVLCEQETYEKLLRPLYSTTKNFSSGYKKVGRQYMCL